MATQRLSASLSPASSGSAPDRVAQALTEVAQRAQAYSGASGCLITVLCDGQLVVFARCGIAPAIGTSFPLAGSYAGIAVQASRVALCNDAEADPGVDVSAYRPVRPRSLLVVPFGRAEETVRGEITVLSELASAFTNKHIAILRTLADVVRDRLQNQTLTVPAAPIAPAPVVASPAPAPVPAETATRIPLSSLALESPEELLEPAAEFRPQAPAPAPAPAPAIRSVALAAAGARFRKDSAAEASITPLAAPIQPTAVMDGMLAPLPTIARRPSAPVVPPMSPAVVGAAWRPRRRSNLVPVLATVLFAAAIAEGLWILSIRHTRDASAVSALQAPAAASQAAVASPVEISARSLKPAIAAVQPPVELPPADASPADSEFRPVPRPHAASLDAPAEEKSSVLRQAKLHSTPAAEPQQADEPAAIQLPKPAPLHSDAAQQSLDPPKLVVMARNVPDLPTPRLANPLHVAAVTAPVLVRRISPDYPSQALHFRMESTVDLTAHISKEGQVVKVSVVKGGPPFQEPAIAAVMHWRYKPAMLDGAPTESDVNIVLNFKLPKQ